MSLELTAAEGAAKIIWGFVKPFAVFIGCAAIGFIGAEAFEHRGPGPTIKVPIVNWSISPFGESLEAKLDAAIAAEPTLIAKGQAAGVATQAAADKPAFDKFTAAVTACQATAAAARNTSAGDVTKTDAYTSTQAAQAFAMGKATCGVTDASLSTTGAPSVGLSPGGLPVHAGPDFADLFNPAPTPPPPKPLCPPEAVAALTSEPLPPKGVDASKLSAVLHDTFGEAGDALYQWFSVSEPVWGRESAKRLEAVRTACAGAGQ